MGESVVRAAGFDLTGTVALVTGGSRGLGKEMVRGFARQGADVVVASRKREACEQLAAEVTAETGRQALGVACHVGRWGDCDRLVETAYERFGHVDVLVNNAGMSPLYPSLAEVTEELFDKVQAVNLRGPFRLSRGGEAHEIVGAALYLASDAASYTTGAILKIDGGTAFAPA